MVMISLRCAESIATRAAWWWCARTSTSLMCCRWMHTTSWRRSSPASCSKQTDSELGTVEVKLALARPLLGEHEAVPQLQLGLEEEWMEDFEKASFRDEVKSLILKRMPRSFSGLAKAGSKESRAS